MTIKNNLSSDFDKIVNDTEQATFGSDLEIEAVKVMADPQFEASPTLTRLLKWLIDETLAGRGDEIKSYAIAVHGLGRNEDFDSKTDSYPRVQVGRLKRALEGHYAQISPVNGLCIFLHQGSYRIELGTIAIAYPQLHHPPPSLVQSEDFGAAASAAKECCTSDKALQVVFLASMATIMVFLAVLAAILLAKELDPLTAETVKHSLPGHQVSTLCPQLHGTVIGSSGPGSLFSVQNCS